MLRNFLNYPMFFLLAALFFRIANQVVFKLIALKESNTLITYSGAALVITALVLLVVRAYCWQKTLSHYTLSFAYSFNAFALVGVVISGALFFNETIAWTHLLGTAIIVFGVLLMLRSQASMNSV